MNLAVSSLAWDQSNERQIFDFFEKSNISQVEIVFNKIKQWDSLTEEDVLRYRQKLDYHGLKAISAQSIFFGTNIELTDKEQIKNHFDKLINYSKIIGLNYLVFGSPKMRKGASEDVRETLDAIDSLLDGTKIKLLLEPNARNYGGNYWFDVKEIVQFLGDKYCNISTMLDLHNVLLENRNEHEDFIEYMDEIDHIHVSEVNLGLLTNFDRHEKFAETLRKFHYQKTISYEVLKADGMIESINNFSRIYKNEQPKSSKYSKSH